MFFTRSNDRGAMAVGSLCYLLALLTLLSNSLAAAACPKRPIILDRTGGFSIGGRIASSPTNPASTISCDHGYVEYFIPAKQRKTSLVMWHSSSTQVWQNRWDGGEGYKDMYLRRNYPVYLWDGPRVGRANWPCETVTNEVRFGVDQINFIAWNFGPSEGNFWPEVQFPKDDPEAWRQATRARYIEYDTNANVRLHADAAAIAADSGKLGKDIVYLTNSAGGFRAQMTAIKSNTTNIRGFVAYEAWGYVLPDTAGIPPPVNDTGFGPFIVPLEDFKKLAKLTAVQFVWGNHRIPNAMVQQNIEYAKLSVKLINELGGNAELLLLEQDAGLLGKTHIPFADLDNDKVAALLDQFLKKNNLDGYV
jgi:hypothetical protein